MSRSLAKSVIILLLLLVALALLAGCDADETEAPDAVPVTDSNPEVEEAVTEPAEEPVTEVPPVPEGESSEPDATVEPEDAAPEPTAEPTATPVVVVDVDSACVNCHTDVDRLKELAEEPEAVHLSSGEGSGGDVPPLEAWEKVLVSADALQDVWGTEEQYSAHGRLSCVDCHGGSNVDDKAAAHEGVVRDPSDMDAENSVCAECHIEHAPIQEASLHRSLAGYDSTLLVRWDPEQVDVIDTVTANHCDSCHASCGQCHVSMPTSAGGGLADGHVFKETPSMTRNCTGCHGSRVKDEYTGRNEGYPADVHLRTGRMACVDCHDGAEMHGIGIEGDHRYDGERSPRCEDCHQEAMDAGGNPFHTMHGENLSCQVCHSIAYKSCYNCHVQQSDEGVPYFEIDESEMGFAIGRNPLQSEERPYDYVTLRHVPIAPTSFEFYGENLLANFDAAPTWVYATPHNIQLNTPQAESCDACHTNPEWFLMPEAVRPKELTANRDVVVEDLP